MPSDDVFPRRNLGFSEGWGRIVENRIRQLYRLLDRARQAVDGSGRAFQGTIAGLASEVTATRLLYTQLPRPVNMSTTTVGFPVDASWRTVASLEVEVPIPSSSRVQVSVLGDARLDEVLPTNTGPGTPGSPAQFSWPFPLSTVTSEYGMRIDPVTGVARMHNGIDFSFGGINGTSIIAPASGVVSVNSYQVERGNWIEVAHPGGLSTRYYHLQAPSPLGVGTSVTKGSTSLGLVGTTGASTGPHLHWETLVGGSRQNPRDFMASYGIAGPANPGTPTVGDPQRIYGRLKIGNLVGQETFYFPGLVEVIPGGATPTSTAIQWMRVVFGADTAYAGSTMPIELQLRSSTGPVALRGSPQATLTVIGSVLP